MNKILDWKLLGAPYPCHTFTSPWNPHWDPDFGLTPFSEALNASRDFCEPLDVTKHPPASLTHFQHKCTYKLYFLFLQFHFYVSVLAISFPMMLIVPIGMKISEMMESQDIGICQNFNQVMIGQIWVISHFHKVLTYYVMYHLKSYVSSIEE